MMISLVAIAAACTDNKKLAHWGLLAIDGFDLYNSLAQLQHWNTYAG